LESLPAFTAPNGERGRKVHLGVGETSIRITKESRLEIRTLRRWAISILIETGAIKEYEEARIDSGSRRSACTREGLRHYASSSAARHFVGAVTAIAEVLEDIGDLSRVSGRIALAAVVRRLHREEIGHPPPPPPSVVPYPS